MAKILVIEDSDPLRRDLGEMLEFEGHEVVLAQDGLVGIEKAEAEKPDLIICDHLMPRLSAEGVLKHLNESPDLVAIPVILLTTAVGDIPVPVKGDSRHFARVVKPFIAAELCGKVKQALESIA